MRLTAIRAVSKKSSDTSCFVNVKRVTFESIPSVLH